MTDIEYTENYNRVYNEYYHDSDIDIMCNHLDTFKYISKVNESNKVVFGCTVQLENIDTGESVTYKIVGEDEADIKSGLVSYSSPVARAIIGKMVDDTILMVRVGDTPCYKILFPRLA